MTVNRRIFLGRVAAASALGALGTVVPRGWLAASPGEALLHLGYAPIDEAAMRALAARALEAARAAGAVYADLRINVGRTIGVGVSVESGKRSASSPAFNVGAAIGVRAVTESAWGFAGQATTSPDEVVQVARLAVKRAKAARALVPKRFEFAPAPVVPNGRWETPMDADPFSVPFGDQQAYFLEACEGVERIKGLSQSFAGASFRENERLFASTEGSLIWQRFHDAQVSAGSGATSARDPELYLMGQADGLPAGGFGYEALTRIELADRWRRAGEAVARAATLPVKATEVGRYDVVFGPGAVAQYVVNLIATGLQLNRARGDLVNGAGTTYAMPPADILGKYQLGSPLLTITCERARPRAGATVGWDEEGVKPDAFTLVQDGVVVDYITTRETAPTIASWYRRRGEPLRSHGCAALTGFYAPSTVPPNLTVRPGQSSASLDDLIGDIKHGFYVPDGGAAADHQLLNVIGPASPPAFQIVNGKIAAVMKDFALQFNTPQFWRQLAAVGRPDAVSHGSVLWGSMQDVNLPALIGVSCAPMLVRGVNVVNTGRQA
jgi:TldD protein